MKTLAEKKRVLPRHLTAYGFRRPVDSELLEERQDGKMERTKKMATVLVQAPDRQMENAARGSKL